MEALPGTQQGTSKLTFQCRLLCKVSKSLQTLLFTHTALDTLQISAGSGSFGICVPQPQEAQTEAGDRDGGEAGKHRAVLRRWNQQRFCACPGKRTSYVWHFANEAGAGGLHSWTWVSKFHCSLGCRHTSPSGPRSFRDSVQSTQSRENNYLSSRRSAANK